jgi:hypothetical protein
MSRLIAAVAPEPQKMILSSGPPPSAPWMIRRASSRRAVVCRPVKEASVCVLAYHGRTCRAIYASMEARERPEAV